MVDLSILRDETPVIKSKLVNLTYVRIKKYESPTKRMYAKPEGWFRPKNRF